MGKGFLSGRARQRMLALESDDGDREAEDEEPAKVERDESVIGSLEITQRRENSSSVL